MRSGAIATVMGRFYAMDMDKRWDRVERAYRAMVYGEGHLVHSAAEAVRLSYANGATDEFIEPSVVVDATNKPVGLIEDGDSVIFFNFRSDRAREICHALSDDNFEYFDRGPKPPHVFLATMTAYDDTLTHAVVAFPPNHPDKTLGKLLSLHALKQLRLAETEKYAHVTFFFNGGVENIEEGEDRILIPSPKVRTYDLQPEMSAKLVTDALVDSINSDKYDVIVINFANPDMVGHTGVREAIIKAVSFIDSCLGRVIAELQAKGGTLLLTADHGNAEQMLENGKPMTAHTTNPVPFILVAQDTKGVSLHPGRLEDIAPTVLQLLGIEQPPEMTGHSLIEQ
ncbi:MAG: 2,3-bisphosphoglycerate-independent phosphoglycerate mutase, partial [Firmicutes bacterium]|nr:2,3-bisphosphoglycerate-independent phosphoglycerate mutase [Bacillota bacterium]